MADPVKANPLAGLITKEDLEPKSSELKTSGILSKSPVNKNEDQFIREELQLSDLYKGDGLDYDMWVTGAPSLLMGLNSVRRLYRHRYPKKVPAAADSRPTNNANELAEEAAPRRSRRIFQSFKNGFNQFKEFGGKALRRSFVGLELANAGYAGYVTYDTFSDGVNAMQKTYSFDDLDGSLEITYLADQEEQNVAQTVKFSVKGEDIEAQALEAEIDRAKNEEYEDLQIGALGKDSKHSIDKSSRALFGSLTKLARREMADGNLDAVKKISHFLAGFYSQLEDSSKKPYDRQLNLYAKSLMRSEDESIVAIGQKLNELLPEAVHAQSVAPEKPVQPEISIKGFKKEKVEAYIKHLEGFIQGRITEENLGENEGKLKLAIDAFNVNNDLKAAVAELLTKLKEEYKEEYAIQESQISQASQDLIDKLSAIKRDKSIKKPEKILLSSIVNSLVKQLKQGQAIADDFNDLDIAKLDLMLKGLNGQISERANPKYTEAYPKAKQILIEKMTGKEGN